MRKRRRLASWCVGSASFDSSRLPWTTCRGEKGVGVRFSEFENRETRGFEIVIDRISAKIVGEKRNETCESEVYRFGYQDMWSRTKMPSTIRGELRKCQFYFSNQFSISTKLHLSENFIGPSLNPWNTTKFHWRNYIWRNGSSNLYYTWIVRINEVLLHRVLLLFDFLSKWYVIYRDTLDGILIFRIRRMVGLKKERSIFIPHSLDRNVRHAARVANTFARGNSTRCCGHDGRVTRGQ